MRVRLYSFIIVAATAALFMSAACGGGATAPSIPATEPVAIEGVGGSTDVAVDSTFTKTFDPEADCSTVTDSTCYIALATAGCNAEAAIDVTLTCSGDSVEIDPDSDLEYETSYVICIDGVEDTNGDEIPSVTAFFTTETEDGDAASVARTCTNSLNCETGEMCLFGICSSEGINTTVDCYEASDEGNQPCEDALGEGHFCSPLIEPSTGECPYYVCVDVFTIMEVEQYPGSTQELCEAATNGAWPDEGFCYMNDLINCIGDENSTVDPFITNAHTDDGSDEFDNWVGIDDTTGDFAIVIDDVSLCSEPFLQLDLFGIDNWDSTVSLGISTSANGDYAILDSSQTANLDAEEYGESANGLSVYVNQDHLLLSLEHLAGVESGGTFYLEYMTECDESGCDNTSGNPWDVRIIYSDLEFCY